MSNEVISTLSGKPKANTLLDFITEKSIRNKKLDWLQKSKGQFYTHNFIGEKLVISIVDNIRFDEGKKEISIIDPFCGDGRLICSLLKRFHMVNKYKSAILKISYWDIDSDAVKLAGLNIQNEANKLGLNVLLEGKVCDTFLHAENYTNYYDICVTNPPWLILKPDKKEKDSLSKEEQIEYVEALKNFDDFLSRFYPLSLPSKKYGGWGTNLARCGTEVALRLISNKGICGIVSPASLIGDQVSINLREWIFNNFYAHNISYYVAEAKLFGKVDQASITLILSPKSDNDNNEIIPSLFQYDKYLNEKSYKLDIDNWAFIKSQNYVIPVQFGIQLLNMNKLFAPLPTVGDLEKKKVLWLGREIDETRIDEKLVDEGEYRFIKGKMIVRYNLVDGSKLFVDTNKVKKIPKSVDYYRLIWRDVSRATQKRRLIATIIPPTYITGNSLHVAYFIDNNIKKLRALLAIMNSLVFEVQVRTLSSTNHVSLGVIRETRLPKLTDKDIEELSQLVDSYEGVESEINLEIKVAQLYGLSYRDFSFILSLFEKISAEEKEKMLMEAKGKLKGR
ncbi:Alw26I/Eco31I/Esp3I family type II restriction adenine-specific DNA-methyltransferase [Bacillus inaquosorum]|uniref:Alw26I/Eco31I/Esp3I family type II restriction adenine-specific DNA-methyltransferase n=1 Tax=Bacillus inaquosorum TaxID=483913 RepID=UPI0022832AC9|nr:Alw26I/Eco31I/Esp3I family type II restriction adenine-specific DNA-methyltransferase [Bacillus inaquosorum]MCY7899540.1 Alw26I/Eco31I/Esp3I family type II restriction adenine-specific DNA-methyltransferase [Bacillus inaquosorum]MCY8262375.1 Alw26I/Eco31I/Esp3I family type II restriction adenine-specific DNA-methyltransferase [Bacillus inaquosorum]MCY8283164.1 Alw26I/Eco31I/Esp3I family type II restriction adenine-specific DNA-methyltransferase [Bacillus inaquosorum]MCY9453233.1 Alw26I/Eco31